MNRSQLQIWGIPAERIYSAEVCTFCGANEFHSYRRDREKAGRMLSVVGILT
jgi:copper oxidase (laccase) domain-containing protein